MIHDAMFEHIIKLYVKYRKLSPDGLITALCEWFFLGRYTGFRKSEWCHKSKHTWETIQDELWGDRPNCLGLIFEDITFQTEAGANVPITAEHWFNPLAPLPAEIHYMKIRIRKQKNNNNYETLTYAVAKQRAILCPVTAGFRIKTRGYRLGLPQHHPAAVCLDPKTQTKRLITGNDANNLLLRQVASKVYNLRPGSAEPTKWSTHSIRVTACNLLHRAKFSDSYIKNRLRWRSDSFLMYLRNTFYTADDHAKALDLELSPHTSAERRQLEEHELIFAAGAAAA
jgi:hypothetical protein